MDFEKVVPYVDHVINGLSHDSNFKPSSETCVAHRQSCLLLAVV